MSNDSFKHVAAKHGLTPERLDKVSAELYSTLAPHEARELQAIAELIEDGTPPRLNDRDKGASR